MAKAVIRDIDALCEQYDTKIRFMGEDRVIESLKIKDHIVLGKIDNVMNEGADLTEEEALKLADDMQFVVGKLIPSLSEEEVEAVTFNQYLFIRELVEERLMRERGMTDKDIEKAKKQQRQMQAGD